MSYVDRKRILIVGYGVGLTDLRLSLWKRGFATSWISSDPQNLSGVKYVDLNLKQKEILLLRLITKALNADRSYIICTDTGKFISSLGSNYCGLVYDLLWNHQLGIQGMANYFGDSSLFVDITTSLPSKGLDVIVDRILRGTKDDNGLVHVDKKFVRKALSEKKSSPNELDTPELNYYKRVRKLSGPEIRRNSARLISWKHH